MEILSRDIHDGRFLNLMRQGLEAGKVDEWGYKETHSGTPQGGILSPLLSNIYMNELDSYVEDVLIPQHTNGQTRRHNKEYREYERLIKAARDVGDKDLVAQLEQKRRKIPSRDTYDPNFRRLKYVRYADDFILSFIGTKQEAEAIRDAIAKFLQEKLKLELSMEKTKITHAKTEKARFLGYDISIYHVDEKIKSHPYMLSKRRTINGCVRLGVPYGLSNDNAKSYMRNGKSISLSGLLMYSDAHIIDVFQARFRGIAEYYKYAVDVHQLRSLKNIMQQSLVKTLAHKFKISVPRIYRKYRGTQVVDDYNYQTLQVEVPTKHGIRIIYWGAIPLRTQNAINQPLRDFKDIRYGSSTDLIQRLQADKCEICGSQDNCEVHHVRKLADLKKRWAGRKEKPTWVVRMIAMQRKTLVVCRNCHDKIHAGQALPNKKQ